MPEIFARGELFGEGPVAVASLPAGALAVDFNEGAGLGSTGVADVDKVSFEEARSPLLAVAMGADTYSPMVITDLVGDGSCADTVLWVTVDGAGDVPLAISSCVDTREPL